MSMFFGMVFNNGVVLGADGRVSAFENGKFAGVLRDDLEKIVKINDSITIMITGDYPESTYLQQAILSKALNKDFTNKEFISLVESELREMRQDIIKRNPNKINEDIFSVCIASCINGKPCLTLIASVTDFTPVIKTNLGDCFIGAGDNTKNDAIQSYFAEVYNKDKDPVNAIDKTITFANSVYPQVGGKNIVCFVQQDKVHYKTEYTYHGQITGGSININNNALVDEHGKATFKDLTIIGGNINIGNGSFKVDSQGNAYLKYADIYGGSIRLGNTTITEQMLNAYGAYLDETSIYDGRVKGGQIEANSITANQIKAGSITANEIKAGTITANEIAANSITAREIMAGSVTAEKMLVDSLSAISANLGTINTGTINSVKINSAEIDSLNLGSTIGRITFLDVMEGDFLSIRTDYLIVDGKNVCQTLNDLQWEVNTGIPNVLDDVERRISALENATPPPTTP